MRFSGISTASKKNSVAYLYLKLIVSMKNFEYDMFLICLISGKGGLKIYRGK